MTAPLVQADLPARPPVSSAGARHTARLWVPLLVAGWLGQAALRIWFSRGQAVPLANPDETAYLITARVLAGGPGANLSYSTLYPAGYPALISPVFWFAHDAVTAYRAVLVVNALISALLMPLAFAAGRRLGLERPVAYAVAMVTALLPAGFFYGEYAMSDAIYPVVTLAWLLATHSWLTARTLRTRFAAAVGSALLAGYADAVHSRGLVIAAGYVVLCGLVFVRRLVPRDTAVAAIGTLGVAAFADWAVNLHIEKVLYGTGARSLSGQAMQRLHSVHGTILVLEMAAGQMWRFFLDSWGLAAVGFAAAVFVVIRRGVRTDLRIMAMLAVAVTIAIAVTAPAALPPDQPQAWASGRYLDGMITAFFVVGAVVLLRADRRRILASAALVAPAALVAGVVVDAYAGTSVPTNGFGAAFNFAEPAVLTQNWTSANVALATLVALCLLGLWVAVVLLVPRVPRVPLVLRRRAVVLAGLAAVSVAATAQMTWTVSRASTVVQQASMMTGLKPGDQIAVSADIGWQIWVPQAFEVSWTELQLFYPSHEAPPAGVDVVELPWPGNSSSPQASWPGAPRGWHVAASSQAGGWVAWRDTP
jgi:hypothetical protein